MDINLVRNRYESKDYKKLYEMQLRAVEVYVKRDKEQNKKINELKKEIAKLKGIIRYRKF